MPSHVSPPTPGSIHEGGELGYVLTHAFGAAFDNPDLLVVAVVGDGEAETAPARGIVEGDQFLEPGARWRGAPDPAPQRLQDCGTHRARARQRRRAFGSLLGGHGYDVHFVEGDDPLRVHQDFAATLDALRTRTIRAIQTRRARTAGVTRPAALARHRAPDAQGMDRAQGRRRRAGRGDVPRAPGAARGRREPIPSTRACSKHGCEATSPSELFDEQRAPRRASSPRSPPKGDRRMGANPHANGGKLLVPLELPDFADYAVAGHAARAPSATSRPRQLGAMLRDIYRAEPRAQNFRLVLPRRDQLQSPGRGLRGREPLSRWSRTSTTTITSPPTAA